VTIKQVKEGVKFLLKQPQIITPFIHGKSGIGKSSIIKQIAKERNISFIDLRLSQLESADIRGIPHIDEKSNSSRWYPPETIPFEIFRNLKVPETDKTFGEGGILFLDELNRARFDVLQSVFQLVLDRSVGLHKILDNWFIVCAGNLGEEDQTEITEINDSALKNRFAHFIVDDIGLYDCWMEWAENEGNIHKDIIGFLKVKHSYLYTQPTEDQYSFCTPRIWEQFSNILNANKDVDVVTITEIVGNNVINSAAIHFVKYMEDKRRISPTDVINKYNKIKDKFKDIGRDQLYSIANEVSSYIKGTENLSKNQFENIHLFIKNNLEDDHKVAFLKNLTESQILLDNSNKGLFIDHYLELFPEESEYIALLIAKTFGENYEPSK
jgi:hypothetical protein